MGPMTPEVDGNDEFAKWVEQWIAEIQHSRISAEQIPPEKRAGERHSANRDQELPDDCKVQRSLSAIVDSITMSAP